MGKPELAMMSRALACVLLGLCLVDVSQGAEVYATGNPHMPPTPHQELSDKDFHKQCSAEPCIPAINSLDVLREPMPTQTDTHLRTILVKSQLGDVIPVYLFCGQVGLRELVAEQLRVGMKAPAWMLALLAATRVK